MSTLSVSLSNSRARVPTYSSAGRRPLHGSILRVVDEESPPRRLLHVPTPLRYEGSSRVSSRHPFFRSQREVTAYLAVKTLLSVTFCFYLRLTSSNAVYNHTSVTPFHQSPTIYVRFVMIFVKERMSSRDDCSETSSSYRTCDI